ncbi:hypothetical protein [Micrococcus terreus]|uniref:Transcriptional regulator, AbiEi antitoxin, Type IV TA system n=1 Tax=Micrococcus terreus TaxID=574650 RepID=A0A1I7MKC0_9MICC|nr:hypothetical protein [Micrococcus terreus]SFV22384.1 hypothetical protein SAMN04487966_10495 [Micrococcus terreus]
MHPTDDPATDHALLVPGSPFTAPELQLMAQTGMVRPLLGGLYRSAATPADAALRAAAVLQIAAPVLAGHWCAVGRTAAWVHVGGTAPTRLEAAVSHFHRPPALAVALPLVLRQLDVAAPAGHTAEAQEDVQILHGLRCTTPDRTLEDLLRDSADGSVDLALEHTVQRLAGCTHPAALRARFERRRRLPGMLQARERLEAVLERTVVTV